METPIIRTLTCGVAARHPLPPEALAAAVAKVRRAQKAFQEAGYEVQTIRLTTRPVFDDLGGTAGDLLAYARRLQTDLDGLGVDHFSLGPAQAARPGFPVDRLAVIADLVAQAPAVSCAVQIATAEHGIRAEAVMPVARTMVRIAELTEAGAGNFRFAALACVGPGHPFFPASYHDGVDSLTIGLQGAGTVTAALAASSGEGIDPSEITALVREAVTAAAAPVVDLGRRLAQDLGLRFGGIDLSPAPSVHESIGEGIEAAVGGRFGDPGTLAVVGAITRALRTTGLPTCGYNGLMLPVLEDRVLARDWAEGRITPHQLLGYSAICGTGLDTVPLSGETTVEQIAGLLLDVATLATRLDKPLSARLFPLPGKRASDRTEFGSPYLIDIVLP